MNVIAMACALLVWGNAVRALVTVQKEGMMCDVVAAGSEGELFVGCKTAPASQEFALARLTLSRGGDGTYTGSWSPLVPAEVCINNAVRRDKNNPHQELPVFAENPLRGQYIGALAAYNNLPLVAFGVAEGRTHNVALIHDSELGRALLLAKKPFGDALGAVARSIQALAGGMYVRRSTLKNVMPESCGLVFAAVTPSDDSAFQGQPGAGIAVAQILLGSRWGDGLVPLDASGGNGGPQAAALPTSLMQIDEIGTINGVTALVWNEVLGKLFVALDMVDGGCSLAVGSVAATQPGPLSTAQPHTFRLSLAPVITTTAAEEGDYLVASKEEGITLQQLGIMNASTGFHYAIVGRDDDRVYALPLTADGLLAERADTGQEARILSADHVYTADDHAACVGAGPAPAAITYMQVMGDCVLVSCAGEDVATQGVFSSQALFDVTGAVVGWSAWERRCRSGVPVYGFARDRIARLRFLTGERDTLGTQVWGQGGATEGSLALVNAVNTFFPAVRGGVQAVVSASGAAAGWYNTSAQIADGSSLLIFTGRDRCAVALTTVESAAVSGEDTVDAVHFWQSDLSDRGFSLGMVTAAAVSRSDGDALDEEGWLFIGGTEGIAVLSRAGGSGWHTLDDLSIFDTDHYRFKLLKKADGSSFTHVRQLAADENYFYVLCDAGLYRCPYDADAFKATAPGPLNEELIAAPEVLLDSAAETMLSFVITGDYAFLGTTKGLWVSGGAVSAITNCIGEGGWVAVPVGAGGRDSFGVCAQLSFAPGSTAQKGGLLSVMTADVSLNIASVCRVAVPDLTAFDAAARTTLGAVVHRQADDRLYATLLGQLREHFYTDGGVMIDTSSVHHVFFEEGNGMMRILPVSSQLGALDAWLQSKQPVLDAGFYGKVATGIAADAGTGALFFSGEWGVRILQ